MAKKILIGLGVAVALLAAALVALVALVDVNRFKPQIAQAVKDRYDRTLTIDGDLSLAVFPRLGVALPKTTLSAHGSAQTFASLDGARVSVALLPLLSGRIEAGKVSVYGLTATIDRRADGSLSIDDLLKPAVPAPAQPEAAAAGTPEFEIGGIELANANLSFRDLAAKNTITLTRLNLNTGRLAPKVRTPVELSTQFAATQPQAQGELRLKGELDLDLAARVYGGNALEVALKATLDKRAFELAAKAAELRLDAGGALSAVRLTASAKGALAGVQIDSASLETPALAWHPQGQRLSVGGVKAAASGTLDAGTQAQRFEAALAAPKIDVTPQAASGERMTASLKLAGGADGKTLLDAALTLEGLAGTAADLKVGKLSLNGTLTQPLDRERVRRVVAAITSPAAANLEARTLSLPKLAGDITMEDPALPQKSVKLPVTAAFALDAKKERVDARFSTRFDETALSAEFDVRGFAPVRLGFEASADKLNLDRYFPPARPGAGHDGADTQPDAKVDLTALKDLNLAGEARVGQLQLRGVKAQNLRVVLRAADGRLAVAPLTASLYGGSVQANAFAQADNRMGLDARLTDVNVEPLMKDALGKDVLAGRGNVTLDLATAGATVSGLKRGLDGSGAIALRDGAVKGINVAQTLRNARAMLTGGRTESSTGSATEKTDFSELNVSFAVKDGVARSDDLDLKSPLLRIGGTGAVDLAAGTLDYTVRATVVGSLRGQDGRDISELRGVTVPVKLSGPFEKIGYSIEWGGVAQEVLRLRATEQLRLPARTLDALKGLFGK
jgi:AsmA protein